MINEMEKKSSLNGGMSDLEFTKNSVEMMRYRVNGLSYKLGFLGIAGSIFAAFICLNSFNPITLQVILKILMNIVILLAGFLCCEKAKSYSKSGSLVLVGLGAVCLARIFWIPLQLVTYYSKWVAATTQEAKSPYEKYLGRTIYDPNQISWLPANGYFRGFVAMGLLVIAAAGFITAGVIGYLRAKKLETYLESLKETK